MNNYQSQIISLINFANNKIQIAVSWFTDEVILNHLIQKTPELSISVLVSSDEVNLLRHNHFRELIKRGATVKKLGSSSPFDGMFMHSKFIILDERAAYGGSYNFTSNAQNNYESFKKWDASELSKTVSDFKLWMSYAVDFFDGITNVEAVVRRMKDRFMEEEAKRRGILSKISSISFSEEKYIAKKEKELQQKGALSSYIRKEDPVVKKLKNSASSLSAGISGVTSGGNVSTGSGTKVKKHSFHGGNAFLPKISEKSKNHYSLLYYQKHHIAKQFETFKTSIVNGVLIATGTLKPTDECDEYKVRIEYAPGMQPRVYIKSHELENISEIHLYSEGFLCLFDPSETKWKDTNKLSEYTIPWTIEWILYYEIWKHTGKWEGKESKH